MTMKAVDRASDTAAEGWEAQAARCPPAGSPVLGSRICLPLTSVPDPLRARPRNRKLSGTPAQGQPAPTPTGQPFPAPPPGGVADRDRRARPSVDEGVLDAPVGQDFDGPVEREALADASEVQVQGRRSARLRDRPSDFESGVRPGELERDRPGPSFIFYQSPDVDIKGAVHGPPDLFGQAQALVGFDADRHRRPRPEAVEPRDVARRIETAEEPFDAVDLVEHGPGGLARVGLFAAPDENLEKGSHGVVRETEHGRDVPGHQLLRGRMARSKKTRAARRAARAPYRCASRRGIWARKWRYGSIESRAVTTRTKPAAAKAQKSPVKT